MTALSDLLAIAGAPDEPAVAVSPGSRWKAAPAQVIRRSIGRVRATVSVPTPVEHISWHAPAVGESRIDALRERLLEGRIYVHRSQESPIGRVRDVADFNPADEARVTATGGLRQFGEVGGRPAMLRVGIVHSPADPLLHHRALELFASPLVPSALASGTLGSVRWSIESLLPGTRPRMVGPPLLAAVSGFLTSLPRPQGRSGDAIARAATVFEQIDPRAGVGELVRRSQVALAALPAVVTHGDLWAGNLLVDAEKLSGVIDWDSWSEQGVPGVDILHLFAERRRRGDRTTYGGVVEARFWDDESVADAVESHMRMAGAEWHDDLLTDLAIAWWITTIAGAVRRSPTLITNPGWVDANVAAPHRLFHAASR